MTRAAIAMAALYALVLQAVLGGLAVPTTLDPAHIICVADAGTGEGPAKPQHAHGHLPCCTAAHVLDMATPPLPPPVAVTWPARQTVAVTWRPEIIAVPRAPPGVSASPRAPPVA